MTRRRMLAGLVLWSIVSHAEGRAQLGAIRGTVTVAHSSVTVADVVVFLVPTSSNAAAAGPIAAEMDQRDLHFVPRVISVTPGSTVSFSNSDRVMHNVFHPLRGGGGFDLGLFGQGERRAFTFSQEGAYVIFCHVHPEMVGYVVVLATPWRAVTDDSGRFAFENVPAGSWVLRTWHNRFEDFRQPVSAAVGETVRLAVSLTRGAPGEPRVGPATAPQR
jgi:plastocyanin